MLRLRLFLATRFLIVMPASAQTQPKPMPAAVPSAGRGQGLVLVNETSEVYHCFGDHCYGKTRQGKYRTEAAAKTLWCARVARVPQSDPRKVSALSIPTWA